MSRPDPGPIRITTAPRSRREEVAGRQRRYLISMALRTVCFLLAVVFAGSFMMWVFIAASFVLPSFAVVAANAHAPTDPDPLPDAAFDPVRKALGPSTEQ